MRERQNDLAGSLVSTVLLLATVLLSLRNTAASDPVCLAVLKREVKVAKSLEIATANVEMGEEWHLLALTRQAQGPEFTKERRHEEI